MVENKQGGGSAPGIYKRGDGRSVNMADMNPYHRLRAAEKAEREGDKATAQALRASGPLPEGDA